MILPAIHFRLLGFVENGKLLPTGEYSLKMAILLPSGDRKVVNLIGNKKLTPEDVKNYFQEKNKLLIKSSTMKAIKMYMLSKRGYKKERDEIENNLISKGLDVESEAFEEAFDKEIERRAYDYIYKIKSIKKDFILKSPISKGKDGEYYCRCIIYDKDKPSKSGMYIVSSSYDTFPVEISPIHNNDGEFIGYYKVATSKLMSQRHWFNLIDHYIRTINKFVAQGKEVTAVQFHYDIEAAKRYLNETQFEYLKKLFGELNDLTENNKILLKNKDTYIQKLEVLKNIINKAPQLGVVIQAQIMIVNANFPEKTGEKGSLVESLRKQNQIFVNLNYSKDSMEKKEKMIELLSRKVEDFSSGRNGTILASYIIQNEVIGPKTSWGFMEDNIQTTHAIFKPKSF